MSYAPDFSQPRNGSHPGSNNYDNPSFNVHYLGAAMLSQMSTGLGTLQKPLKDLYFGYQKPSGNIRLNANLLTVTRKGLVVSQIKDGAESDQTTGANVFYPMPSIHFWEAVRFVAVREKDKKYKCAFESLNVELGRNLDNLYFPLDFKKEKHLTKIAAHPVLFAIVLRRPTGLKALDLHAFICGSDQQAMALVQHLNNAHSTFSDDEVHESGVFGYNIFSGNSRELPNSAPDADPRVNQRRIDVTRSASHLGTPSAGISSFPQLPPRNAGYALTQGDFIGEEPSPQVMESVYGHHRGFNPRSDPRQHDGPQRSAVNRSYTVYQTRSEVLQPNPIGFDMSRAQQQPYQNQFERFGEPSGQIYGSHPQTRRNDGLSEFNTRPLGSAQLPPPPRQDIYGQFGQVSRQGPYEYTQSLGQLNGDSNRSNYAVERGYGEPMYQVSKSNNQFQPNSFDSRPPATAAATAAPVVAPVQKHSTSPSYRRKFPAPDPSDELGIYRLSVPVNKIQTDGNKLGQDVRRNEPLPLYNNQKPLPDIPHPNYPVAAVNEPNRLKFAAVPEPQPARLPPTFEDAEEQLPGAARKSVFGIFPREAVKQAALVKSKDQRGMGEGGGEVRGDKPVALVQPRKVQGIRVLPLGGEDIYGQLSKPDAKKNADERRPLVNENQRFEQVYNSDQPRSKALPLASAGVAQKPTSASTADNSNSNKEENVKDKEIASIFGNINFDKTLSPPQQTNFESSLGYLP